MSGGHAVAVTAMLAVAVAVVLGCIELCGAFGGPTVRQGSLLGDNPMNALWGIEASRRASRHAMLDIPTHDARVRVRRARTAALAAADARAIRARTSALASIGGAADEGGGAAGLWRAGARYSDREKRVLQALSNIRSHLERGARGRRGRTQSAASAGSGDGPAAVRRATELQPSTQLAAQALAGGDTSAAALSNGASSLPVPTLSLQSEVKHRKMDVGFRRNIQDMMTWNAARMKAMVKHLEDTRSLIKTQEAELADLRTMVRSSKDKMQAVRVGSRNDLLDKIADKSDEAGPVGIKGPTGAVGSPGKNGINGKIGAPGIRGYVYTRT